MSEYTSLEMTAMLRAWRPAELLRRRRVIFVPADYVLALLSRGLVHNQFIRVPEPLGLPETAQPVGIWNDWNRNAFAVVVTDPSFDEVPLGAECPEMFVNWSHLELAVKSPNGKS